MFLCFTEKQNQKHCHLLITWTLFPFMLFSFIPTSPLCHICVPAINLSKRTKAGDVVSFHGPPVATLKIHVKIILRATNQNLHISFFERIPVCAVCTAASSSPLPCQSRLTVSTSPLFVTPYLYFSASPPLCSSQRLLKKRDSRRCTLMEQEHVKHIVTIFTVGMTVSVGNNNNSVILLLLVVDVKMPRAKCTVFPFTPQAEAPCWTVTSKSFLMITISCTSEPWCSTEDADHWFEGDEFPYMLHTHLFRSNVQQQRASCCCRVDKTNHCWQQLFLNESWVTEGHRGKGKQEGFSSVVAPWNWATTYCTSDLAPL